MKKLISLGLSLIGFLAFAAEVTPEMAKLAAQNWRTKKGALEAKIGMSVEAVQPTEYRGAKFHRVKMSGGGVIIMPCETTTRPVMMFIEGDDFVLSDDNPGLALIVGELAPAEEAQEEAPAPKKMSTFSAAPTLTSAEKAWDELLAPPKMQLMAASDKQSKISDVRVAPILKTRWDQTDCKTGKRIMNYYTPDHDVCGCVATTMSQIMRTLEWPSADTYIAPFQGYKVKVNGVKMDPQPYTQGGYYDWSKMPGYPTSAITDVECQMIGKLVYDVGISLSMDYSAGGSGASGNTIAHALKNNFNYSSTSWGTIKKEEYIADTVGPTLRANLDAKLPVAVGVTGHSIALDGYGYIDETLFYHLNFGWASDANAWYAPPDGMIVTGSSFTHFTTAIYNIYTNQPSQYVLSTGRVFNPDGTPCAGVRVHAENKNGVERGISSVSDDKGIYALYVQPGDYTIVARKEVKNDNGEVVSSLDGETTASPTATGYQSSSDGIGFTVNNGASFVKGNAWGRDITLSLTSYAAKATVGQVGEIAVSDDGQSAVATIVADVARFGVDANSATVTIELMNDATVVNTQTKTIASLGETEYNLNYTGLTADKTYEIDVKLTCGEVEFKGVFPFVTAEHVSKLDETLELPPWTERGGEDATYKPGATLVPVLDIETKIVIDGFASKLEDLAAPAGGLAVSAVWVEDDLPGTWRGVFAFYDGERWVQTAVPAEEEAIYSLSLFFDPYSKALYYLVRKDDETIRYSLGKGMRGPRNGVLASASASGAAELKAIKAGSVKLPQPFVLEIVDAREGEKFEATDVAKVSWTDTKNERGEVTKYIVASTEGGQEFFTVKAGAPVNGRDSFESYALNMNADDPLDRPYIKARADDLDSDTITFNFFHGAKGEVIAPKTGYVVTYVVETADSPTAASWTVAAQSESTGSVSVDLPKAGVSESAVRYFKPKFVIE